MQVKVSMIHTEWTKGKNSVSILVEYSASIIHHVRVPVQRETNLISNQSTKK